MCEVPGVWRIRLADKHPFMIRCLLVFLWAVVVASLAHGAPPEIRTGHYVLKGDTGTLLVRRDAQQKLTFEINTIGGNCHTCDVAGVIRGHTGHADSEMQGDSASACRVAFVQESAAIRVVPKTADTCRDFCGMRAGFEGTYFIPPKACTAKNRQQARDQFMALYRARRYQQAEDVAQTLLTGCNDFMHRIERDQVRNDLALAQYHGGKPAQCLKTLSATLAADFKDEEGLKEGGNGFYLPPCDFDNYIDVAKATWFNRALCTKASLKKSDPKQ